MVVELGGSEPEAQIVLSAAIALLAFGSAYVVTRARKALSARIAPLAVDFGGAAFTVGIVVAAVWAISSIWGLSDNLQEGLGLDNVHEIAPEIAVTVVVLIAIQVFTSIASRLLDDIERESNAVSEHEQELIYRLTLLLLWSIGIIVVLGVWEVDLSGLLVGAGFLGIVLGLAAQKTLGSLFGGLVMMFSRPFEVGDWVAFGPEDDEGIVTDITLMNTRIQAFDGEYVVVPNDVISSQTVRNRSQKGRLRIEVEVGIDYGADVERAREVALDSVKDLDIVMDVPRPECVTKGFDESAVTLGVRGWIEHPSSRRRWRTRTQMVREVKAAFAEEGIKIPYPQRELSGREEQGGLRLREGVPGGNPRSDAPTVDGTAGDDASAQPPSSDGSVVDDADGSVPPASDGTTSSGSTDGSADRTAENASDDGETE